MKNKSKTLAENALKNAVSISWCGCHKIYIALNQEAHDQQVRYGYHGFKIDPDGLGNISGNPAIDVLLDWYENSCGLRFINSIEVENGTTKFTTIIGQFEDENEE